MKKTRHPTPATPIRILTAVPVCDGHDSAISTINLELSRAGIEVIYLGYNRTVRDIVRAAIQEDVHAIGISSYNGGHLEFFKAIKQSLIQNGAPHIGLFGGGGGTISPPDAKIMLRQGTDRIFFPGTPLSQIVTYIQSTYARPTLSKNTTSPDLLLARLLTTAEKGSGTFFPKKGSGTFFKKIKGPRVFNSTSPPNPRTIGITGPGGAGKTTLIDELILRLLRARPHSRLAILSHDPSIISNGALLGDRAAMIYAQDDRVFMRSLGTRGHAGGIAQATSRCLQILRAANFDYIFIETVGIGQEALPFAAESLDLRILVMSPDYGSQVQLQKIAMLDDADLIVINKADLGAAATARAEIARRISRSPRHPKLIMATAKKHNDAGVDQLLEALA